MPQLLKSQLFRDGERLPAQKLDGMLDIVTVER